MKRLILFLIIFSLSLQTRAGEANYYYVTKTNDHVSKIIFRARLTPIYGKSGKLLILKKANLKNISDIDAISLNEKLYFPDDLATEALGLGQMKLKDGNELVFKEDDGPSSNHLTESERNTIRRTVAEENKDIKQVVEGSRPLNAEDPQSRFVFSIGSGYSRVDSVINATGATAVLLSKPLIITDLKWEHLWSEVYESFIHFSYSSIPYQEANQGQIFNSHPSLSSTSFGVKYNFQHPGRISLEAGVSEEVIIASYQAGTATVEAKPLTFLQSVYSRDVLEVKKLKMTLGFGASYFLSSTFGDNRINAGTKYLGQLQITQSFKNFSFFASGEYSDFLQKSNLTEQKRRDLNGNLGFIIPLGAGQP